MSDSETARIEAAPMSERLANAYHILRKTADDTDDDKYARHLRSKAEGVAIAMGYMREAAAADGVQPEPAVTVPVLGVDHVKRTVRLIWHNDLGELPKPGAVLTLAALSVSQEETP